MADYREQQGTVKAWRRCRSIMINNPYNQPSQIHVRFDEEDMVSFQDGTTMKTGGMMPSFLTVPFDPAKVITMVDTETLQPTGATMTFAEVYQILFSAYITCATERDQQA